MHFSAVRKQKSWKTTSHGVYFRTKGTVHPKKPECTVNLLTLVLSDSLFLVQTTDSPVILPIIMQLRKVYASISLKHPIMHKVNTFNQLPLSHKARETIKTFISSLHSSVRFTHVYLSGSSVCAPIRDVSSVQRWKQGRFLKTIEGWAGRYPGWAFGAGV